MFNCLVFRSQIRNYKTKFKMGALWCCQKLINSFLARSQAFRQISSKSTDKLCAWKTMWNKLHTPWGTKLESQVGLELRLFLVKLLINVSEVMLTNRQTRSNILDDGKYNENFRKTQFTIKTALMSKWFWVYGFMKTRKVLTLNQKDK